MSFTCRDDDDKVVFRGWARMALPIEQFSIIEVRKPNVGENKPAGVEADVIINLKGIRLIHRLTHTRLTTQNAQFVNSVCRKLGLPAAQYASLWSV